MFTLSTNAPEIESELKDVVRLFTTEYDQTQYQVEFTSDCERFLCRVNAQEFSIPQKPIETQNALQYRKQFVRQAKNALYRSLQAITRREIPWGSLTGIRPTKLVYEMLDGGVKPDLFAQNLQSQFFVSPKKAQLVCDIVANQSGYFVSDDSLVNLYIHIPFCPSRCHYCSFVTASMDRFQKLVAPYVDALCSEIRQTIRLLQAQQKRVFSVYMGGGTPTALQDDALQSVLEAVNEFRLIAHRDDVEYTCEAGRPETLTASKIQLLKAFGVNRVSVNPQSLNPETLNAIGRAHTVDDFFAAFDAAVSAGFVVNVDLIAGLSTETPADFCRTLRRVTELSPHNLTVHTLSRKRGSAIKEQAVKEFASGVTQMTDDAYAVCTENGYLPYYLYRQKLMLENLENVGYCKPGYACANNITVMEESLSIAACGAGAISKKVLSAQNRIERLANIKDIALYLERFDEIMDKKHRFFTPKPDGLD